MTAEDSCECNIGHVGGMLEEHRREELLTGGEASVTVIEECWRMLEKMLIVMSIHFLLSNMSYCSSGSCD